MYRFSSISNIYLGKSNIQVYVTMYLNDCQRFAFYEGIGLDAKEFDMHVIIEVSVFVLNVFKSYEKH